MSSNSAAGVVQKGRLLVYIAENGLSFRLDVDENTLVETVQRDLESLTGIQYNDQLLLCLDMKLEPQRHLSFYRLPSNGREVFVFNKERMKGNSSPPPPEQAEAIDIPNIPPPTSSSNPHPLDDAPDPAMTGLPSYERQFRYHFPYGHAIYKCTLAKMDICEKLFRQVKVQEKSLEIAGRNMDHYYKIVLQYYRDFVKFISHQYRRHTNLLVNFGRDVEKMECCKLMPLLHADNRECLLDFVKEENLQKVLEDCADSHRQFENKVSDFTQEIGELKLNNAERLCSSETSFIIGELEATIQDHRRQINEQQSVMQNLRGQRARTKGTEPLFVGTEVKKGPRRRQVLNTKFKGDGATSSSTNRKHHILWTRSEVKKLIDGVSRHGVGKWIRIKNELFSSSPHRTHVDLKDKWRNLLKTVYIQTENDRGEGKKRNMAWRPLPKSILQRVSELSIKYPYSRDLR